MIASTNAMANERNLCANYIGAISAPSNEKEEFLMKEEIIELFAYLPDDIGIALREGFLRGVSLSEVENGDKVVEFFRENSLIIPALAKNPGTYSMLEKMYHFEAVRYQIDFYFLKSIPGGQALRQRYDNVNIKAIEIMRDVLKNNDECFMIDIGSGPGRNGIDICAMAPELISRLKIENIDIDNAALELGRNLTENACLSNVTFVNESMTSLKSRYPGNVDVGLLIGILCGLKHRERVMLLRRLKPYFKKGGKIIAAGLTNHMLDADLFCSYVLYETAGWVLQYQPYGQIRLALEEAGWQYESCFSESSYRLYEIGVGVA